MMLETTALCIVIINPKNRVFGEGNISKAYFNKAFSYIYYQKKAENDFYIGRLRNENYTLLMLRTKSAKRFVHRRHWKQHQVKVVTSTYTRVCKKLQICQIVKLQIGLFQRILKSAKDLIGYEFCNLAPHDIHWIVAT